MTNSAFAPYGQDKNGGVKSKAGMPKLKLSDIPVFFIKKERLLGGKHGGSRHSFGYIVKNVLAPDFVSHAGLFT